MFQVVLDSTTTYLSITKGAFENYGTEYLDHYRLSRTTAGDFSSNLFKKR